VKKRDAILWLLPVQQLGQFAEVFGGKDGIPAGVTYCGLTTWQLPLLGKWMLSFGVCKGFLPPRLRPISFLVKILIGTWT